jgi:hypothetical protein
MRLTRRRLPITSVLGIALLLNADVWAANEAGNSISPVPIEQPALDEVLVSGEQPGPALWKVSHGTHILWLLGEVSPLPRKVTWRSKQFESLLDSSQEVILHNSAQNTEGRQAARLSHANELSEAQSLRAIVSPGLYARTEAVAKIYGVREPLDNLSPSVVGGRFANASLKTLNLQVVPVQISVEKLARKARVRITNYAIPVLDVPFDEQLRRVRENATAICPLESVVRVLEDGGAGLRSLANAWAVGDIDALRRLMPQFGLFTDGNRSNACSAADQQKPSEYLSKRTAHWLVEAERALRENESTLAVVPMPELFATDGYLAALRARGYEVVEPD